MAQKSVLAALFLLLAALAVSANSTGLYTRTWLEPSAEISDPPPPRERPQVADTTETETQAEEVPSTQEPEAAAPAPEAPTEATVEPEAPEQLPPPPPPMRITTRRTIDAVDLDLIVERIDADRRLLSEIRKDVPEARWEAEGYLGRLKELASMSDPVRLVPLANRVLSQAPIYFEWLGREFSDDNERAMEYYVGGARGFSLALETFKSAVMFTIINRLDVAGKLITEFSVDSLQ